MECQKGFEVLNIAQLCFELLLLAWNQKTIWNLGHAPEGNVHDRKYKDKAATFFGGACFFGVGFDKGFWNTPMFCYYFQLLFVLSFEGGCARICMMYSRFGVAKTLPQLVNNLLISGGWWNHEGVGNEILVNLSGSKKSIHFYEGNPFGLHEIQCFGRPQCMDVSSLMYILDWFLLTS